MRRFVVLGCNHSTASLDEIATTRVPEQNREKALAELRARLGAQELAYLETCHRTEFYVVYEGEMCPGRLTMALGGALPEVSGGRSTLPAIDNCVALQGDKAARHLFRVACGLDALMVGESQVLGQVKDAYRSAAEAGIAGPLLQTLFEQAFRAAKRVRTETALSRRPVSLVSLAERRLRDRLQADRLPIAVLGAGEMARVTVELVRKLDPERDIIVFNRGEERGRKLASTFAAEYRPLDGFAELERVAAVVAATSADRPVVQADDARRLAPCLFLDLSLPANIAATCREIEGIELADQRELSAEAESNRAARAEEIERAETILDEQLRELSYEMMERYLSPVARHLIAAFREVARGEMERLYIESGGNGDGNGHIEKALDRLSQRLVRVPLKGLREVAWMHSPEVLDTFLSAVDG